MSKDVEVKVSRNALAIVGAIALVIVVLGVGLYVGRSLGGEETAQGAPQPADQVAAPGAVGLAPGATGATADVPANVSGAAAGAPANVSGAAAPGGALSAQGPVSPVPAGAVPVADSQPRLWIEEVDATNDFTYELGEIPANAPTEHTFTISNIGKALLVIQGVNATCGCTTAELGKETLQPGESTTVRVAYDPRTNGEQGQSVTKSVLVRSNDPLAPLAEFRLAAQVAAE